MAVNVHGPCLGGLVEIKANGLAGGLVDDVIALAVTFHEVATVVGIDDFGGGANGVGAAPELDGVDDEHVTESGHLVDRQNPEGEEDKLVDELGTDLLVPVEYFVGQGEAADARVEHEAAGQGGGDGDDDFTHIFDD